MIHIPFIIIAVALSVAGQLLLKKGISILGDLDFSSGFILTYLKIFTSPLVIMGVFSYVISVFFWIYALSKVNLSFAAPFLALTYVFIVIGSWLFLGENVTFIRWFGVFVICLGVVLVAKS